MANRLDLNSLDIMHTIGAGSFGRVRLAKYKKKDEFLALKVLKKVDAIHQKQVDHVMSEHLILRMLSHPFVVSMQGESQDERYIYFALEYIPGGELFSYLKYIGRLESSHAKVYSAQIILVFEYLHNNNII